MRISPQDGKCRTCDGELEIIDADDVTTTVACVECSDSYVADSSFVIV